MGSFLIRRLGDTLLLLLLISILVFVLFTLIPGDYLTEMELNPAVSSQEVARLRHDLGLDRPVLVQYFFWLGGVASGNLGYSFIQHRPAVELISDRLINTLLLSGCAFLLTLLLSVPAAVVVAVANRLWLTRLSFLIALSALSVPVVLAAVIGVYLAFLTDLLPVGGLGGIEHLVLPSLVLALPMAALIFRNLRLELESELGQEYIIGARARGLPRWRVVRHAVQNAANPLISMSGLVLGSLLSGSVVVESVFDWPGLGALTVDSILARDLFVALNCVLVAAVLVVVSNLVADLALAWNDPRVRLR